MMRTWNFGAGPAMLPLSVLKKIQDELLDWKQGMSVMEFGHRTPEIEGLFSSLEQNLRVLLGIPSDFTVLFMHGGARAQFSALPLNLLSLDDTADYITTGHWSNQAALEAKKFSNIHIGLDISDSPNGAIPPCANWSLSPNAKYVHYTDNETIEGIEFLTTPNLSQAQYSTEPKLIADVTSSILSKSIDWSKMGAVYASAQKNLGIAGVCVLIIRQSWLTQNNRPIPAILDFNLMAESKSMYNTPPVFACYVALLITEWVLANGGLKAMQALSEQRSSLLYDYIDNSDFYINTVDKHSRSRINVPFNIKNRSLEPELLALATAQGFKQLKGHRVKGGFRASMYNAMPIEGVQALVHLLKQFEQKHR